MDAIVEDVDENLSLVDNLHPTDVTFAESNVLIPQKTTAEIATSSMALFSQDQIDNALTIHTRRRYRATKSFDNQEVPIDADIQTPAPRGHLNVNPKQTQLVAAVKIKTIKLEEGVGLSTAEKSTLVSDGTPFAGVNGIADDLDVSQETHRQLERCLGDIFSSNRLTTTSSGGWLWWWWLLQFADDPTYWYWIMWYFLSKIFLASSNENSFILRRTPGSLAMADQLRKSWWLVCVFGFIVWISALFTGYLYTTDYDGVGTDLKNFASYVNSNR